MNAISDSFENIIREMRVDASLSVLDNAQARLDNYANRLADVLLSHMVYELELAAGDHRGRKERTMRRAARVINELISLSNPTAGCAIDAGTAEATATNLDDREVTR